MESLPLTECCRLNRSLKSECFCTSLKAMLINLRQTSGPDSIIFCIFRAHQTFNFRWMINTRIGCRKSRHHSLSCPGDPRPFTHIGVLFTINLCHDKRSSLWSLAIYVSILCLYALHLLRFIRVSLRQPTEESIISFPSRTKIVSKHIFHAPHILVIINIFFNKWNRTLVCDWWVSFPSVSLRRACLPRSPHNDSQEAEPALTRVAPALKIWCGDTRACH